MTVDTLGEVLEPTSAQLEWTQGYVDALNGLPAQKESGPYLDGYSRGMDEDEEDWDDDYRDEYDFDEWVTA